MNKREQKKLERRKQIIQAAKELIVKNGIQHVQLQDVADEVGIGIATFYRYFANKELLLLAVNNEITMHMTIAIKKIANETLTAYEQIERILTYYIELTDDPQHQFMKFIKAFETYKPMPQDTFEYHEYLTIRREIANILYQIAKNGENDQSIRAGVDIPQYVFTVVQNMSYFSAESYFTEHDPALPVKLDAKKQLFLMREIFLQFIQPRPSV